ncbi:MAG: hypothetical protein MPK62_06355 [Alphaproteobacteria bacterium]|nr:hypothetical protein [Alphaproteobacteria bacterium]
METRRDAMPREEKVTRIIDCFTRNIAPVANCFARNINFFCGQRPQASAGAVRLSGCRG